MKKKMMNKRNYPSDILIFTIHLNKNKIVKIPVIEVLKELMILN
jgi:hypothetical protein